MVLAKRHLILAFLILLVKVGVAQYPFAFHVGYPDPLPTPIIYDMLADRNGFIWLATDKGLLRFDSRTFQVLPFDDTRMMSVGYLQEDDEGTIWCVNFYKQLFYVKNDTLRLFHVHGQHYDKVSNILNVVVTQTDVLIASFSAIVAISKRSGQSRLLWERQPKDKTSLQYIAALQHHVFAYSGKIFNTLLQTDSFTLPTSFLELRMAADDNILLGVERGNRQRKAVSFNGKKTELLPGFKLPPEAYVYHLSVTDTNEFWLCTQSGVYQWDYATGNTTLILPNVRVSDIVKDFQGNYWISTLDDGLYKCANLHCKMLPPVFNDGKNITTRLALLPDGNIAAGNNLGEIIVMKPDGKLVRKLVSSTKTEIELLFLDKEHHQLFTDGGLFDISSGEMLCPLDFGKAMAKDAFGNIILASFNRCAITTNSFKLIDTLLRPKGSSIYEKLPAVSLSFNNRKLKQAIVLRGKRCSSVVSSRQGLGFWVAYEDGLFFYSYDGMVTPLMDEFGKPLIATHLLESEDGLLLVSTPFSGLFLMKDNRTVKRFTTNNGLQSNNVRKVFISGDSIWVLTDESLDLIDRKKHSVQDYYADVGLESLNVYDFLVNGDQVYLATSSGILRCTKRINQKPLEIRLVAMTLDANGAKILPNARLAYNNNEISINFQALHFNATKRLQLCYRLVGYDSTWHHAGIGNNKILYNALPPGSYRMQAYVNDVSRKLKSNVADIFFTIAKPFWQSWWFVSGLALAVIAIVILVIRGWMGRFRQQQTVKERLLNSQLVAIRSQMNPHFLYNVLNTVQGLVYANRKAEAGEMLGNFSDLMRRTLTESDLTTISLDDEIETLRLYLQLEQQRFDSDFHYFITVPDTVDLSMVFIPPMLIQPFVENAIKHGLLHKGGSKELTIDFQLQDNRLVVTINDNGIGREASAFINLNNRVKSAGFATKATDERINLFNQLNQNKIEWKIVDKVNENGKAAGTLVCIAIPIRE